MRPTLSSALRSRAQRQIFINAPKSVTSLVAALLEPAIAAGCFLLVSLYFNHTVRQADLVLCLVVIAFTFPGRNRFEAKEQSLALSIGLSWASLLAVLAGCGYLTDSIRYFDSSVLWAWGVLTPVLQWQAAAVGRAALRSRAALADARTTAVMIGGGPLGAAAAQALQLREDRTRFLGWFDDRSSDRLHADAKRLLGGLDDIAAYVSANGVKEVYISLPLSHPRIVEVLERVQGTTASIFFVPDLLGIGIIQGRLRDINGLPVVGICETPFTGINELVKRTSDVILAAIILALVSPLMLAIAIGVKMSSPGPIIFRQKRNGLYGDEITVYKFRSMTTQDNGPTIAQATKNDSRITQFGAFLRRTSLDELPQFINVLQGRMSIVGPRPHAVAHNEQYRQMIKAYMVRHKVRPGITGWAQVNGYRGETDTVDKMRARIEYDLEYLRNWSLWLDLKIILRTISLVFLDRNAY
jgi:putative colanic acid biosynthesis UDP-glucose lipid carrier transferase